jgi:hypothetical protein
MSDDSLEPLFQRLATVNPFLENRVSGPAQGGADVAGIHQEAFDRLVALACAAQVQQCGIGVMLWGEAGVGKSHLLARLGRWAASGYACLAYLHNLQAAPENLPRSLLHTVISILTNGQRDRFHVTPLYRLIFGAVLAAVGGVPGTHSWARLTRSYHAWIDRLGPAAGNRLLYDALFTVFRSSSRAARGKEDGSEAALAVRWLAGQPLDPVEARLLGLPVRRRDEAVALEDDEQIKQALTALARLAGFQGVPLVLAFDQVDNLDEEQFRPLSRFLQALLDTAGNLLVITAGVQPTLQRWREAGVVQDSAWHRIAQETVHLSRITAEQALQVVLARLDDFFAPFAALPGVAQARQDDPLFPLGRAWEERHLGNGRDLRPREVINWARDGWRRQQEQLARLGGPGWLADWRGEVRPPGPPPEPGREDEVVDRAVEEALARHREQLQREPGQLPPDADRLASLLYDLLGLCRDDQQRHGVVAVERVPPPRRNAHPSYHLDLRLRRQPDAPLRRDGVLVLTAANATSVAGFLRRLLDDARPLDRLVVLTDERVGMPLGERGQEYLEALRGLGPERFVTVQLGFAEFAELAALHAVIGQARAGDLEVETAPGQSRPLRPEEVLASYHRRDRIRASRPLRELLGGAA